MGKNTYGHLGQFTYSTLPARSPLATGLRSIGVGGPRGLWSISQEGFGTLYRDGHPISIDHPTPLLALRYNGQQAWLLDETHQAYTLFTEEATTLVPLPHPSGGHWVALAGPDPLLLDAAGAVYRIDATTLHLVDLPGPVKRYEAPCAFLYSGETRCRVEEEWVTVLDHTEQPHQLTCFDGRCCMGFADTPRVVCFKGGVLEHQFFTLMGELALGRGFLCSSSSQHSVPSCVSLEQGANTYGQLGNGGYADTIHPTPTLSWERFLQSNLLQ